jgi:tetratricopeptide (TPR) repeat protein
MIDYYNSFDEEPYESPQEPYPDYFYDWDESLTKNGSPRFLEDEEFYEIIEIYLEEGEFKKAKQTIQYALKLHPENEDLVYDILLLLSDFELWNDLLVLSEKYQDLLGVWAEGHKLTALLHLGMEEDAFLFFRKVKNQYDKEKEKEDITVLYQAMGEALQEADLFDASVILIEEAISILGADVDFYWLQLQAYLSLEVKEKALDIANKIEQINPMDGENWHRLGSVYIDLDEMEKAIDAFEFAESLDYRKKSNYLGLITAYEKNGNHLKALEKTKDFLYLYPESYMINILAANICSEMEMWEEALFYVDAALEIVPELDALYLYKSAFFLNLGEKKKAILTLEEGIKQTRDVRGDLKKELERLHNENPNC